MGVSTHDAASKARPLTERAGTSPQGRQRFAVREPERYFGYLFLLPAIALLVVFRFVPLVEGGYLSMTRWDGINEPTFTAFENYRLLFTDDPVFRDTMVNTLIVLMTLPIWVLLPLLLATLIHLGVAGGQFYRNVYFIPVVLASVIIGSMFNILLRYDGNFNQILGLLGIEAVDWLGESRTALGTVIVVQIWSSFGMAVLIFLAGLASVPSDLIDAAKVAGANLRQTIWYVVIPILMPIIEFVSVITMISMLTSMFGLIYVMTAGGPGTATYLPEYLIWILQGELNRPGYASAAGMIVFFLVGVLAMLQIRFMRREVEL